MNVRIKWTGAALAAACIAAGAAQGAMVHHLPFQDGARNGSLVNQGTVGGTATKVAGNDGYFTNDVPIKVRGNLA